jgi:hypothetical protein
MSYVSAAEGLKTATYMAAPFLKDKMKAEEFDESDNSIPWRRKLQRSEEISKNQSQTMTYMAAPLLKDKMKAEEFDESDNPIPWRRKLQRSEDIARSQCQSNCAEDGCPELQTQVLQSSSESKQAGPQLGRKPLSKCAEELSKGGAECVEGQPGLVN